jgi:mono/diheme cytochrome c family protein
MMPQKVLLAFTLLAATGASRFSLLAARQDGGAAPTMPGQPIYEETCSRCHGLQGQDGKAPVLVPFRWNYSQAIDIVRHGGACGMPAFTESQLSDDQVKQIVDYLKTLR